MSDTTAWTHPPPALLYIYALTTLNCLSGAKPTSLVFTLTHCGPCRLHGHISFEPATVLIKSTDPNITFTWQVEKLKHNWAAQSHTLVTRT